MPEVSYPAPSVTWAQRKNIIILTVCLEDCQNPTIKLDKDKLFFSGVGGTEKKQHEVTIQFYNEIENEKSTTNVRPRVIEFVLKKKDDDRQYWPQLTKDKKKCHWLKIDFSKWEDEDGEDDSETEKNKMMSFSDLCEELPSDATISGDMSDIFKYPDSDDDDMPGLE